MNWILSHKHTSCIEFDKITTCSNSSGKPFFNHMPTTGLCQLHSFVASNCNADGVHKNNNAWCMCRIIFFHKFEIKNKIYPGSFSSTLQNNLCSIFEHLVECPICTMCLHREGQVQLNLCVNFNTKQDTYPHMEILPQSTEISQLLHQGNFEMTQLPFSVTSLIGNV